MPQTLDQKRAALAWGYATAGVTAHEKKYKKLAKGASALIMNSGLMPTLAYYNGQDRKKAAESHLLLEHLLHGLVVRLQPQPTPANFSKFMEILQSRGSREYLRYTDEALELLKWIRQFVDAVETQGT